jgi:hypothetical protein
VSTFTTPLVVEYLDGRRWRLTQEFDFASEALERIVRVPVGFVTDFASIPRVLWALLPPTGPYGKAAVIHDMLYQHPECLTPRVTREQADYTLCEGMVALCVKPSTLRAIYWGVRAGGGLTWDRYRRQEQS